VNLSTLAPLRFPAATGSSPSMRVTDLVLASDGSFAWIAAGAPNGYEVHRLDAGDAADTVVDSGPNIQPGSLALGGRTLYWTRAGRPSSAPLP
jgi:hypothetical protein